MARQQKLSQSGQSYKLLRNEDTVFALRMPRPLHGLDDKYMKRLLCLFGMRKFVFWIFKSSLIAISTQVSYLY